MFANVFLVIDWERQDIIQINLPVHVVDIKSEIVRVKLNRIKASRINRIRLRVRFNLLELAARVAHGWRIHIVLCPLLKLVEDRVVSRNVRALFEDCLRRLMRDRNLIPFRERPSCPRLISLKETFYVAQFNDSRVLEVISRRGFGVIALANAQHA